MKDECDINNILRRYQKSGMLAHVTSKSPVYLDVSDVGDYRTALARVEAMGEFFSGLPAAVRSRFANDPAEFLDFMVNPANEAEAKELGLVKPAQEPAVTSAPAPTP